MGNNNRLLQNITYGVLFCYSFFLINTQTIFGKEHTGHIIHAEYFLGLALVAISIIRFLQLDKEKQKEWLTGRLLIFLYFAMRIVTTVKLGMGFDLFRNAFFEGMYLLTLSDLTVEEGFLKKVLLRFAVILNFLLNLGSIVIYHLSDHFEEGSLSVLYELPSVFYRNQNFMGTMTAISILIALSLVFDRYRSFSEIPGLDKSLLLIIFAVAGYSVFLSGSRTSIVALVASLILCFIRIKSKSFNPVKVTVGVLVIMVCITAALLAFIKTHEDTGFHLDNYGEMSEFENKLDAISTYRYSIWKSSVAAVDCAEDSNAYLLLGAGTLNRERKARNLASVKLYEKIHGSADGYEPRHFTHTHNGYIAMLFCTGIPAAILYGLYTIKRIQRSTLIKTGLWFSIIVFLLLINAFECSTVLSRSFPIYMSALILAVEGRYYKTERSVT